MSKKKINKEIFTISELTRDDLEALGYNAKNLSNDMMQQIADDLCDDYCGQLFWSSLEVIADHYGIRKRRK